MEFVSVWAGLNVLLSYLLIALNTIYHNKVILLIGWYGSITLGVKFIFALIHHLYYYSRKFIKWLIAVCLKKDKDKETNEKIAKLFNNNVISTYQKSILKFIENM